jgi:hypothetical protein
MATKTTVDARRETASFIGSDKVEGTAVYGPDDRKIGTVQRVMIDKISGKVGYRVDITEDQLKGAPKFNRSTDWNWSDRSRDTTVYDYYNTPLWY